MPLPVISIPLVLTKEHFEQVVQNLATKKDLEGLATKEDLYRLKSDVRALKADVDDIAQTVDRIDKRDVEDSDAHTARTSPITSADNPD
jgi:hypothetical protein